MSYIFPLLGSILSAINNTLRKKTTINMDADLILIYQYIWIVIWSLCLGLAYALYNNVYFFPHIDSIQRVFIGSISIVGYIGIILFVKALQHVAGGIVSLIANTSVFLMFFLNRYLFPQQESMTISKIILSIVFFVIVGIFLLKEGNNNIKNITINKYIAYPIMTSICRTYFFVSNNYLIQNKILDPIQTVWITEIGVAICATIYYFIIGGTISRIKLYYKEGISKNMILLGLTGTLAVVCFYVGYQKNSANIVNTIRLSTIMLTALFCRLLLGEKLNTKQIILLCVGICILIIFMIV